MSTQEMKVEFRTPQVAAMDNFIRQTNDEGVWLTWITAVPDEATEEDYKLIAGNDEQYKDVCNLFVRLVQTKQWVA